MELFVNSLINWLVVSSMYILVALGFALLFSIMGIINLAHGVIYMVSGYICYQFIVGFGLNQWLGLALTVIMVGLFGIILERFFFRRVAKDLNRTMAVCVSIIVITQTTVLVLIGYTPWSIPSFFPGIIHIGDISFSAERFYTLLIGVVLLLIMLWFIRSTKWGHQMQAIAQNFEGAALQGIDTHRVSAIACIIACGLAATAGCLMGSYLNLSAFMGDYVLVKALIIVILGGLGSITGVVFAGLIVGAIDVTLPLFLGGNASEAVALLIIVIILLFRPQGFFGREVDM